MIHHGNWLFGWLFLLRCMFHHHFFVQIWSLKTNQPVKLYVFGKHIISAGIKSFFGDKSGTALCRRDAICLCDCGVSEPCLIWLLPGWEVVCSICDCPETISRVCICSPNVVNISVAAVVSVWGRTTAGTINSAVLYIIAHSQKYLATYTHPGCNNLSCVICFCRKLSMCYHTSLEIVPSTQLG